MKWNNQSDDDYIAADGKVWGVTAEAVLSAWTPDPRAFQADWTNHQAFSVFTLPSLQLLDLSYNHFGGLQVGEFPILNISTRLCSLDLSSNWLESPIPNTFFNVHSKSTRTQTFKELVQSHFSTGKDFEPSQPCNSWSFWKQLVTYKHPFKSKLFPCKKILLDIFGPFE